jgi:AraC-like DNA-binding protein
VPFLAHIFAMHHRESTLLPRETHPTWWEVVAFLDGRVSLRTTAPDGTPSADELRGGDLIIMPPGSAHGPPDGIYEPARGVVLQLLVGREELVPGEATPWSAREWQEVRCSYARLERPVVYPMSDRLYGLVAELQDAVCRWATGSDLPLDLALLRHLIGTCVVAVARLLDEPSTTQVREDSSVVRCAKQFMLSNLARPIGPADAAAQVGRSNSSLTHLFRRQEGITPIEFLNRARVRRARELLAEAGCPIKEVAAAAGFSSTQYMAKVFRRYARMTPSEYRRTSRALPSAAHGNPAP